MNRSRLLLGGLFLAVSVAAGAEIARPDFMLGVDANYALQMEAKGARWKWDGRERDLLVGMREEGARWLRVRLWTNDDGVNGRNEATTLVERAVKAGLQPE